MKLKTEITELEKRRRALMVQLDKGIAEHETAKAALLKNQNDLTMKAVTMAHSARTALEETIAELDSMLLQKRQLLEAQEAEESRKATLARIEECEREIGGTEIEYDKRRVELHAAIEEKAQPAFEALKRWHELQSELRRLEKSVGHQPLPIPARMGHLEALHPFGEVVSNVLSIIAEGLRQNEVNERRKEAERRRIAAEQRETDRINALYKQAADERGRQLRIGPPTAA
ncbi:MAG TPA: hypothetical protein VIX17_00725 [Pyrinomonadaceae bacterium]|jgi:hypothetical protein